ncbi:MAG: cyanophycinase [Sphingobacteriales bacterium]|jgi:cyanophycinase
MTPKGKLIIIGGSIDKGSFTENEFDKPTNLNFFEEGILRRIIKESGKDNPIVEVLTTASRIPKAVGQEYDKAFKYLGVTQVNVMNITKREQANSKDTINRIKKCDVVMMTGGDQLRLSSILGGTGFTDTLIERYEDTEIVIAGTSAGAAVCSNTMIYQGSHSEALLKGEIKITGGFDLINDVVIDTHFVQRGRIGRLFQAVVSNPRLLGIGLGEDTGLLISKGHFVEAIGSGLVMIVDGRGITDTNITDINIGEPISITNLCVHVMSMYDKINLKTRTVSIVRRKRKKTAPISKTEQKVAQDLD